MCFSVSCGWKEGKGRWGWPAVSLLPSLGDDIILLGGSRDEEKDSLETILGGLWCQDHG